MRRRVQRPADGHVHVEIALGAEPAKRGHARLTLGALDITSEEAPIVNEVERIVRNPEPPRQHPTWQFCGPIPPVSLMTAAQNSMRMGSMLVVARLAPPRVAAPIIAGIQMFQNCRKPLISGFQRACSLEFTTISPFQSLGRSGREPW